MKTYAYEGGIPYEVEVPEAPAAFMRFLDSLPCSCGGEAHDECRRCDDCGEVGAENEVPDDPDGSGFYVCDDCWEQRVIEEEAAYQQARLEDEQQSLDWIREDHEAQAFDAWWQRQKEEGWDNE